MHLSTDLPDHLAQAIAQSIQDQPNPTNFPDVLQTALETFLLERGYWSPSKKRLHITPAEQGSGYSNTSIEHDQILSNLDHETPA